MQIRQVHLQNGLDMGAFDPLLAIKPQVIIVFGDGRYFAEGDLGQKLGAKFPTALIIGCSSAGEIVNDTVYDGTLVVTALSDDKSEWFLVSETLDTIDQSRTTGEKVGEKMSAYNPQSVFVLAPGLNINGSDLVKGLVEALGPDVVLTGGLAGDGLNFKTTYTLSNKVVSKNHVVALGMRTPSLQVSYGTQGGWQPFGTYRRITRATNNILYELDNKSALGLYKNYLGGKADELPGSGLLYPLNVIANHQGENSHVRSILNVDETAGSIMLAGEVKEGSFVRLMHAKTPSLVDGALRAGEDATAGLSPEVKQHTTLGILVSCVGRKAVMGDDANDEVAAVKEVFGDNSTLTGFYSYGEICPYSQGNKVSALHNQTMTVTRWTQSEAS
jgi:hypothetical protein